MGKSFDVMTVTFALTPLLGKTSAFPRTSVSTGCIEPVDVWERYNGTCQFFKIYPNFVQNKLIFRFNFVQNKLIFRSGTCRFKFIASTLFPLYLGSRHIDFERKQPTPPQIKLKSLISFKIFWKYDIKDVSDLKTCLDDCENLIFSPCPNKTVLLSEKPV